MNKMVIQAETPIYGDNETQYSLLRYAAMAAKWKGIILSLIFILNCKTRHIIYVYFVITQYSYRWRMIIILHSCLISIFAALPLYFLKMIHWYTSLDSKFYLQICVHFQSFFDSFLFSTLFRRASERCFGQFNSFSSRFGIFRKSRTNRFHSIWSYNEEDRRFYYWSCN